MAVGMLPDNWDTGLRDSSLATWSRPTATSKKLDAIHHKRRAVPFPKPSGTGSTGPKPTSAGMAGTDRQLTLLCQKTSAERTETDIQYLHVGMARLSKFYRLWPSALQRELCRVLRTEALVKGETVVSRGAAPTRMLFLVSGKLTVRVPQSPNEHGPNAKKMRTLAVLKRGDTCGEAALLGHNIAHADVVVDSAGAVVLSLSYPDFLMTFKEVLGLRQQDRVTYLRSHPLFADVSLADLVMASDSLQLAFLPPNTVLCLGGRKAAEVGGKVYFIAEGECAVRRSATDNHGHRSWQGMYDTDTVSMLGPLDVFGLPQQEPDLFVETVTQVRLFYAKHEDFFDFPPTIRQRVEDTFSYKVQYLTGRLKGLQKMDGMRKNAGYGAFKYKVGNAVLSSGAAIGSSGPPLEVSEGGPPFPGGQERVSPEANSSTPQQQQQQQEQQQQHKGGGLKMEALLYSLRAKQTIEALERGVGQLPDRHTGLPPLQTSAVAPWDDHNFGDLLRNTNTPVSYICNMPPSEPGSPGGSFKASYPNLSPVGTLPKDREHNKGLLRGEQGKPPLPGGTWSDRAPKPLPFDLNMMRPKDMAWPKVLGARADIVETEAPAPQHVPCSVRDRHALIFQRARNVSPRDARRNMQLQHHSDDDDDDGEGELRLLSTAHSGMLENSMSLSSRMERWAISSSRRISSTGTIPRQSHFIDRDLQRSIDMHALAADPMMSASMDGMASSSCSALYRMHPDVNGNGDPRGELRGTDYGNGDLPLPSLNPNLNSTHRGSGAAQPHPRGSGSNGGGDYVSPGNNSSSSSSSSAAASSPFNNTHHATSHEGGAGSSQTRGGKASLAAKIIASNDGGAASEESPHARQGKISPPEQQQQQQPLSMMLSCSPDLADLLVTEERENCEDMHQVLGSTQRRDKQPQIHSTSSQRLAEVGNFLGASQQLTPSSASAAHEMDMALPPSVVLGYESLDPFQWAAVMSFQQGGGSGSGAADSVLPKPNW